jgi:HAD superfamily hydrolase (TIGR01490 family)
MEQIIAGMKDAAIAFFDLDDTLTEGDTDSLWAAWRSRRSIRGWVERAWLAMLFRDFRRGRLAVEEYIRYQRFRLGSMAPEEFRSLGRKFFRDSGIHHIYPAAARLVAALKERGCRVVLLTAQNECIAAPFADHIGMDDMIANRFSDDGARFTTPVKPYSFGEGKIHHGRAYADRAGVPLDRCAFFGDSIYDAPFLGLVGHPHAVNPDAMLERLAFGKGWPVLRFKEGR